MRTRPRGYILAAAIAAICVLYWALKASASAYTRFRYISDVTGNYDAHRGPSSSMFSAQPELHIDYEQDLQLPQDEADHDKQPTTQQSAFPAKLPRIIWQAADEAQQKKFAKEIKTWQTLREFEHRFLSDKGADEFVTSHFNLTDSIFKFWSANKSKTIRRALLQYLVMLGEGGVFCDVTSSVRIVPDLWIPPDLGAQIINVIIGMEYDNTSNPSFVHPVAFGTRTLFSKPGHPVFEKTVLRAISNLEFIAKTQGKDLSALALSDTEVEVAIGPNLFTEAVLDTLQDRGHNVTYATFHDMKKARLVGDVLILPINAFAGGELHNTHATDSDYGTIFVRYPNNRKLANSGRFRSRHTNG